MSFMSIIPNRITILLFCISLLIHHINSYYNIYIPFRTKKLRVDYENDDYEYYEEDKTIVDSTSFLNKWFYNDIYSSIQMGTPTQHLTAYFNCNNSYFSIGKCNKEVESDTYIISKDRFMASKTLKIKEIKDNNNNILYNVGNDNVQFYDNDNFYSTVYINEEYNGIDFIFYDDGDGAYGDKLCGNIGLSVNYNDDNNTNFINQLKKKKIISKYIWTLDYQTLSQGIITIGTEPHFFESNKYYYSQYKTIYANLNDNKKVWSFIFDKINLNGTDTYLKERNVELIIDQGLIIGTEEYKNIIEQIYFNNLIDNGICLKETAKLKIDDKSSFKEYYVYYCDKIKFKGDFGSKKEEKPFYKFNDIYMTQNGFEYIFKMEKESLFEEIGEKVFFLIIFEKNKNNKIWKLGEPFISQYKFVFNQEQKTIGFYNPLLEKIPNSEYDFDEIEKKANSNNTYINNNNKTQSVFYYYLIIIILIIAFIFILVFIVIYIINQKLFKRKNRANELIDNYDYLPQKNNGILNNSIDN